MKLILSFLLLSFCSLAQCQLLTWSPEFITESSTTVELTCDASLGSRGLLNHTSSDVYVHLGVVTNYSSGPSDWRYLPAASVWATTNAAVKCSYISGSKWKYTITGGLRSFFGLTDPTERILRIALLFRSGDGSKKLANADGGDLYVPVYSDGIQVSITEPFSRPDYAGTPETITKQVGDNIAITARASESSTISLYFNGAIINTSGNITTLTSNATITSAGVQTIIAEAAVAGLFRRDTISFSVNDAVTVAPLPAGLKDGINYDSDPTKATLVLFAPGKTRVGVLGDFNNWSDNPAYQMNRTPDGRRFWITLTGLTAGTEYGFQYLIDGGLKVADAYAEKVLDPWNDRFIAPTTYPSLKPYPETRTTGIVSVLQTQQPATIWNTTGYTRPDKKGLVIYELLLRDFLDAHSWQALTDTLTYLKRLGINAIELMPVNEFEGNNSWGYNPDFYFAPDKYYGTAASF
ncbi:MAG: hypothetical protein H7Y03_14860, partial [Chitinophagaceae bacterium]|nr:hypothetical protein [Chitinophagaceae bacterium]